MEVLNEFKKFAVKGSVVDMAVGIVLGTAFTAVVKAFVDDLLMPVLGLVTGNTDFSNGFIVLAEGAKAAGPYATLQAAKDAGANIVTYGVFADTIVHFFLVAFALFFIVRWVNRFKHAEPETTPEQPPEPPPTKLCDYCKSEIAIEARRCPHCTSQLAAV